MSTYRSTFTTRKGTRLAGRASYCVLFVGLIVLLFSGTLFSSPIASAAKRDSIPQQESLARTEVSLVRIVAQYGPSGTSGGVSLTPSATKPKSNISSLPTRCTGLGVIVAGVGQSIWVVTDGSLVSKSGFTCQTTDLPDSVTKELPLTTLSVYLNDAYNSAAPHTALVGDAKSVVCLEPKKCSESLSLFSFENSTILPTTQLPAASSTSSSDAAAIQLAQSLTDTATPTILSNPQQYVIPTSLVLNKTTEDNASTLDGLEGGTPIVDQLGFLKSISLKDKKSQGKLINATEIAGVLKNQGITSDPAANAVSTNWNSGITEYYQGASHYTRANSAFQQAYHDSHKQFQGTQQFIQATSRANTSPGTDEAPTNGINLPIIGFVPYFLLAIIIVGIIVLIVLLFLLNLLFRREHRNREFAEAEKQAVIQAQQIQEMEAQQTPARPVPPRARQSVQQAAPYPVQQGIHGTPNPPPLASFAPAPIAPVQSNALADYPTVDLSGAKQNGMQDMDKTQPFSPEQQRTVRGGEEGGEHVGLEVITSTDPGIKRKYKPNEDSLFAVRGMRNANGQAQQIGLFVVADGMGGHANGQDASRLAIQTIIDYILPRLVHGDDTAETPEKLLVDSVQLANQAVHQHNIENNADMGTTVTATLVIDEAAHIANVGDSRTYLYRTSNGLAKVTRDHSVVASLVDAGIIKPDDIYTHPKRNQIYRSLGEKPFVEVDPFTVQLQPGDKLLLCSDGLWDMVRDPEIKRVLETQTPDPQQLGDNLIKAALNGGGEDNVSVIVINVVGHAPTQPTPGLETIYVQDNVKMPLLP